MDEFFDEFGVCSVIIVISIAGIGAFVSVLNIIMELPL